MNYVGYFGGTAFGMNISPFITTLFVVAIAWSAVWKGIALWKCGRNNQLGWFVVLLVVNTLGILEIIYLLFFQKREKARKKRSRR